jgi:hypothetical protein
MRSIIPFEVDKAATVVDRILDNFDWTMPDQPEQATDFDWQDAVRQVPSRGALHAQEKALREQYTAERELERLNLSKLPSQEVEQVRSAQHTAIAAQEVAIDREHGLLTMKTIPENSDGQKRAVMKLSEFQLLAATEARKILDIVAEEDKEYANLTFRYPIFDRRTQTWGTVHYEPTKHHAVIRLRNSHSEKLKIATQHLVEHLVLGDRQVRHHSRAAVMAGLAKQMANYLWYQGWKRPAKPITFEHIKVLEAGTSNEAFTGAVVAEKSLISVLRERSDDLKVAGVFLFLGLTTLALSSPWLFNFDYRLKLQSWQDGWLSWFSGNLTRLGSALFVGVFLPLIQVWLYWRAVRRKPSIVWIVD